MSPAPFRARSAALFVLFASAAFATSSPLARWARPAHPFFIAFGRLVIAALLLAVADRRALLPALGALDRRRRLTVFGAGALLAAHFACFLWGLDHTSLPAAISLVSLEPLAVVVTAWAILGVAPSRAEQVGVALATVGAIVVAQGVGVGEHRLVGDLVVVAGVVFFGLYLTVARALKDALPARSYATAVYASAALLLLPMLALAPGAFASPAWPPTPRALYAVVALGVVPTILGHTAVMAASRTLPPAIVALVSPGETLGGLAVAAALLGAMPTRVELAGAAIIVLGSAAAILGPREGRAARRAPS